LTSLPSGCGFDAGTIAVPLGAMLRFDAVEWRWRKIIDEVTAASY
jgi:hypothetical protein